MLKDNRDIIIRRKNIYIRILAQKAIFTLNYYADNNNKYRLNDVEDLIEKYIDDPEVLVNMMDLKQNYKYCGTNAENLLSRSAIEVLLTKAYGSDYSDQEKQLQYAITFSNQGTSGRDVLKSKLAVYQMAKKFKLMDQEVLIENNLLRAVALKAKKTLDHLAIDDFSIDEIISMIILNLSEEKDIYRLLNLHEYYSVSKIVEAHKKLRKEVILALIKDQIGFSRAVLFSDPQCGQTGQKELYRIINNINISEANKRDIFRKINTSADIKEFKKAMNIIKDQELLAVLKKYDFLALAKQRYPEFFEKIKKYDDESIASSSQYKLRRVFAEVIINDIYDLELLAYYITGRKDQDHLLRVIGNYETLTPVYQIKFTEFIEIGYEKLSSGNSVLDIIKKAVLSDAINENDADYKEFKEKYLKKYHLDRMIKDIKWNLRKGNIDFNIKTEEEIKDIISIAIDQYGLDLYVLEKMIGTEIRKNYEEIFEIIIEDDVLRVKYESAERQNEIKLLLRNIQDLELQDLEEMLKKNNLSPEQKTQIDSEIESRKNTGKAESTAEKAGKIETSKLAREFTKIADIFSETTRIKLNKFVGLGKTAEIISIIKSLPANIKVKLLLRFEEGNSFLKLIGLDNIIFKELRENYVGEDGQFRKGHMAMIKKQWGISEQEVRKLGDIFGRNGKKARQ